MNFSEKWSGKIAKKAGNATELGSMTFLVFLSAPAGAGIIPADLVVRALHSLGCGRFLATVQRELGLRM